MKKIDLKYEILDKQRRSILPLLKKFKSDFYLAGGTGLALQIGHRDSVDFDFFSYRSFNTVKLYKKIKEIFSDFKIKKIQDEKNTLTILLDNKIKISFFSYPYKLINSIVEDEYLRVASILDISSMKLSAIVSRATIKDYLDIYFILQQYSLEKLLKVTGKKFNDLDRNLILKSLVYFSDVTKEPIRYKTTKITWQQVQNFLKKEVLKIKF
ncbi:MAG: nucleotidyl transferase AbiEii/AbiGii toxin family protein [bacterium]